MPHTPDTVDLQTAAKYIGYGPKKLFRLLRDKKVLGNNNLPYQRYIDQGYFKTDYGYFEHPYVGTKPYAKPLVTPKGLEWLAELIKQEDQAA